MLIILICAVAVGYLLLVIVFVIPQSRIYVGLANSVSVLERDDREDMIFGYPSSKLDVFSDGAILNATLYTNDESPFKRAIACYQYLYDDLDREQGFIAFFEPREPDGVMPYPRYWHGILVVLKPLFLLFNYSDIRMLNSVGQIVLISLVAYAFIRGGNHRYLPAVFVSYFFLMPFTLPMSIQYSSVFYIGFGSLALLMYFDDALKKGNIILYFFLITGIATSYMDLLTYPMFTLGIPLTGFFIGSMELPIKDKLRKAASLSMSWFTGYAGMWAGKILIAVPFMGMGAIGDALGNAAKRSVAGASQEKLTYVDALRANFFMYKNNIFTLILFVYVMVTVCLAVYRIISKQGRLRFDSIPVFLLIMAIPFVWFLVTTEHAVVHAFMTYKNLTVSVFAFCVMLIGMLEKRQIN